jgi:hypothetical protein
MDLPFVTIEPSHDGDEILPFACNDGILQDRGRLTAQQQITDAPDYRRQLTLALLLGSRNGELSNGGKLGARPETKLLAIVDEVIE